jgi:sterol desaturase/sphingolipid hydroxylase (fatty acid hydroxylase superfamily)
MSVEDVIGMSIPATYLFMLAAEQIRPARQFPSVPWWKMTGAAFTALIISLNALVPLSLPVEWMASHRLMDGSRLGAVRGAAAGLLVVTFINYWWHRAEHRFHVLWRAFHQVHHSPHRVDVSGAAFAHPLEMALMVVVNVAVNVFLLGLLPVAAALAGYAGAFVAMFAHWNIRTPQWLGYLLQRPESHCVHHEKGLHANNYGDLPLWDLLFGTFRNPVRFTGEVGLRGGSQQLAAMLAFADVETAAPVHQPVPTQLGGEPSGSAV